MVEIDETTIFPDAFETTTLFGARSSFLIVDAAPSITVPSIPAGIAKSITASSAVPLFVTVAFEPGESVVIDPTAIVAGPCSPRFPRGNPNSRMRSTSVPEFVIVTLLNSGKVVTFPIRRDAGPISPRGPAGPVGPVPLPLPPRAWFWTFFPISTLRIVFFFKCREGRPSITWAALSQVSKEFSQING